MIVSKHFVYSTRSQAFAEIVSTEKIALGYIAEYSMFVEQSLPFGGGYWKANLVALEPKILKPRSFNATPINIALRQIAEEQGVQSVCVLTNQVKACIRQGSVSSALNTLLSCVSGLRAWAKDNTITIERDEFPTATFDPVKIERLNEKSIRYWGDDYMRFFGKDVDGFRVRSIHVIDAGSDRKVVFYG